MSVGTRLANQEDVDYPANHHQSSTLWMVLLKLKSVNADYLNDGILARGRNNNVILSPVFQSVIAMATPLLAEEESEVYQSSTGACAHKHRFGRRYARLCGFFPVRRRAVCDGDAGSERQRRMCLG